MTSMRARAALAAALLVAAIPATGEASPLYERTFVLAADARCRLLDATSAAALAAGQAQARRDALRAGASPAAIAQTESSARAKAGAQACNSPALTTAAARVRQASASYARVERISYPGQLAGWKADRGSSGRPRWRLAQSGRAEDAPAVFGLAGADAGEALLVAADFGKAGAPYAARLILRDAARSSGPYLDRRGLAAGAVLPLARRLPPASGLKSFAASGRSDAGVLAPDGKRGLAFRFPAQAAADLAALDPREAVAVEFLFKGRVTRAYFEVGDFAAGYDFLRLASR